MEIYHSQLKINHLSDMPSTKAAGGGIFSGVFIKDVGATKSRSRRTLSSVGTSSSNNGDCCPCCNSISAVVELA